MSIFDNFFAYSLAGGAVVASSSGNGNGTTDTGTDTGTSGSSELTVTNSLQLWLDATDSSTITVSGTKVTQWDDKSGNNNHALVDSNHTPPNLTSQGIDFDINDVLVVDNPRLSGNTSRSVFVQFIPQASALMNLISFGENSNNQRFSLLYNTENRLGVIGQFNDTGFHGNFTLNQESVTAVIFDGTNVKIYQDNNQIHISNRTYSTSIGHPTFIGKSSGTGNNEYLNGIIKRILVYDRALTDTERSEVYSYLAVGTGTNTGGGADPSQPDITRGLVAHWTLNETSGNRLDSSGNNNTLTVDGTVGSTSGVAGLAADFNGGTNKLRIPDTGQFDFSKDFTIAFWFLNRSGGYKIILSKFSEGTENDFYFQLDGSELSFNYNGGGGQYRLVGAAQNNMPSNQPVFVAGYHDAATKTIFLRVHSTLVSSTYTFEPTKGTKDFVVGGYAGTSAISANGWIDEVRIYDRVLSEAELDELYDQGNL